MVSRIHRVNANAKGVSVDDWCFRPDFLRAFEDEPAENISVIATHFVEVLSFVVFRATEAIQGGLNVNLYDAHFKIVIFKRSQVRLCQRILERTFQNAAPALPGGCPGRAGTLPQASCPSGRRRPAPGDHHDGHAPSQVVVSVVGSPSQVHPRPHSG